jgi:hypothetical protein
MEVVLVGKKFKRIYINIIFIILISAAVFARIHPDKLQKYHSNLRKVTARPDLEFKAHTIGTLWNVITNYGSFGDPNFETTGRPSAEWTGGSHNNYLYDSAIWVSTVLNNEKRSSAYFYYFEEWGPTEGTQFLMGNDEVVAVTPPISIHDSYCVFDDIEPKTEHTPLGIRIVEHGLSWSMPDYDDFIAYQFDIINTGLNGFLKEVYISWWYDIDVSSIDVSDAHIDDLVDFDGWDDADTKTDEVDWVDPLDLDGDGVTGYDEYGIPYGHLMGGVNPNYDIDKIENDGIFDEYTLIEDERGVPVLTDVDVVIGDYNISAGDTLRKVDGKPVIGWKVSRGMSYIYDGDNPTSSENDFGERSLNPDCAGFMGGKVLYADPSSADYIFSNQDSLRVRIVRPYSHQWWNWESDPDTDIEQYDYQKGQHEFSKGYRFIPNPLDIGAPTFDYRFLYTVGPYDMFPGDTVKVVWAEVLGFGLQGVRENADNALRAYYAGSQHSSPINPSAPDKDIHWLLPAPPLTPNLRYSPDYRSIKLVWDNIAEITPDTKTKEIDFIGYKIYRAKYTPSNWTMVAAFDNVKGPVRVENTEKDSLGFTDLPDIVNEYIDKGGITVWGDTIEVPINGIPYYYSVVAYDKGDSEANLPSSESGKTNYTKSESGAPIPVIPKRMYEINLKSFDMSNIKVVPNPYKGTDVFEDIYQNAIYFTNLPPLAKISIFTMTGDLVQTIDHTDGSDMEKWDLISRNTQSIASGLYIFIVETNNDKFIGKFVVMM